MSKYYEWDNFKNIYLEDSFVLGVEESDCQVSFAIDMVLTEEHPMYSSPHKDEQYCYKSGKILFQKVKLVRWLSRNMRPFTDVDGRDDYGNIDLFELFSEMYHLSGDWGEVVIVSNHPEVVWQG